MKNLQSFFEKRIDPVVGKLSNSMILKTMMSSFMLLLPVTFMGSIFSLISGLPIDAWQAFLLESGLGHYLSLPIKYTTEMMGLLMSFSVTFNYLKSKDNPYAIGGGLVSLVSFLILTPATVSMNAFGQSVMNLEVGGLSFYGAMGIFTALILGFLVGWFYNLVVAKGWTIKMPSSVPPFISQAFSSIVPSFLVIAPVILIAFGMSKTQFGSVHTIVYGLIQIPLKNLSGTFGAMIVVAIVSQILWFFGIHGTMATLAVMVPIWMAFDAENLVAFSNQQAIPNIVSMSFFSVYTPGGFGISTAIVLLLSKSERYKTLGKLSVVPAVFNITEPIIFGVPLVLNPIFFIPYVFSNVISLTIAYIVTSLGIVPPPAGVGMTGIPIILQGFLQGSWKIAALQLFLIIIITLFWVPFVFMADRKEYAIEQAGELNE